MTYAWRRPGAASAGAPPGPTLNDRSRRPCRPRRFEARPRAREEPLDGEPLDETVLVDRAREGDLAAYETLVRRYEEPAFRVAWLILRDAAEAEDAAQEAFVRAHAALGRFRVGEPFRPWLLRIVANQAVSQRRAATRRDALVERYQRDAPPAGEPTPEALTLRREQRDAVLAGLARLKQDDQVVIYLRYFADLNEAELAATLGCARGTVKSRLHRALERLRPALTGLFPELARAPEPGREMPA